MVLVRILAQSFAFPKAPAPEMFIYVFRFASKEGCASVLQALCKLYASKVILHASYVILHVQNLAFNEKVEINASAQVPLL